MMRKKSDRQLPLLVNSLRRLLRARGIGYRDIARTLAVSEPTIKRWFAGKGITVERLEDLCAFVDVSLIELIEFAAHDADARLRQLSIEQEQALAQDQILVFIFTIILRGWSPDELWREQGLEPAALIVYLTRLDKLRLIDLLPGNEVRLLTVRDIEWRKDGPMRTQFAQWLKAGYFALDALQSKAPWGAEMVKLSESSLARMEDMIRDFQRNIRLLGEADRHASAAQKAWYLVLISSGRIDLRGLPSKTKRTAVRDGRVSFPQIDDTP
ncbi:helix-turn-helix domain-containing protein [Noviherbaspirillum saxi]|uniref:XRE family transcriptional regulator n=1 Tax=Noviherbaspirillum saxi TaxID=2320863 RepID=A0A3A3G3B7_9BURK|nr:helix-turn-helix transcriptional regulator [Noviherbaspirillum saxi]RJF92563.1 XRE family transcriptional regulator [Noviherbaspirillum saxi]